MLSGLYPLREGASLEVHQRSVLPYSRQSTRESCHLGVHVALELSRNFCVIHSSATLFVCLIAEKTKARRSTTTWPWLVHKEVAGPRLELLMSNTEAFLWCFPKIDPSSKTHVKCYHPQKAVPEQPRPKMITLLSYTRGKLLFAQLRQHLPCLATNNCVNACLPSL